LIKYVFIGDTKIMKEKEKLVDLLNQIDRKYLTSVILLNIKTLSIKLMALSN